MEKTENFTKNRKISKFDLSGAVEDIIQIQKYFPLFFYYPWYNF
jgi:hypothetical protein